MAPKVHDFHPSENRESLTLSLYSSPVSAGFPSPAEGYEEKLDLHEYLIQRPSSTFFCRVEGDSMKNIGIFSGDLIVVDRSKTPKNGSIVVAVINGEHLLKKVKLQEKALYLVAENPSYPPLLVKEEDELLIWGVVTAVIRKF